MVQALKPIALKDKDWIKSDQDGIKKASVGLQQRIHNNLIQCVLHAKETGDTSLFARLVDDTLGGSKSLVRVQAIINSTRKYTPIEKGKNNTWTLGGMDGAGHKRPWKIVEMNAHPFWADRDNREMVVKPVFQQNIISKYEAGEREFRKAWENTKDGQPIDPTKPFYDGVHGAEILDFISEVSKLRAKMVSKDATQEVRKMQQTIRQSGMSAEDMDKLVKVTFSQPHNEEADILSEDATIEDGDKEAVAETDLDQAAVG